VIDTPWSESIILDGDPSDFSAQASFDTSGDGRNGITWDDEFLYLAVQHPDVEFGGDAHWFVAYIEGNTPGSRDGITLGTQTPRLSFAPRYALAWKADGSYNALFTLDDSDPQSSYWQATDFILGTNGFEAYEDQSLQSIEFQIPRAQVDVSDVVSMHVGWVYEGAGFESTYSVSPAESLVDASYDPDYMAHFAFDLTGVTAPGAYEAVVAPFEHTIQIDGDPNDWFDSEAYLTDAGANYLTWDSENLYWGTTHWDVASGGWAHWFVTYFGTGQGGTTNGLTIGTQQPSLPFEATHALMWKADGTYHAMQTYDETAMQWIATDYYLDGTRGNVAENESLNTVEFSVPFSQLGDVDIYDVHMGWIYEGAGFESSYSPSPADSYVGGYDPDYLSSLSADRTSLSR
jgi:hypothetical protein